MVRLNTATVGLAVTPSVISTLLSHFLDRKPRKQRPTAHLSYDEGLHLIRSFLEFASNHTVEELQAFTAQWVPHPQWVKVDEVVIPLAQQHASAQALEAQLGLEGVRAVGGRKWWQRSADESKDQKAEWIEMRADYNERKTKKDPGNRVMFYVHGGAYFFGSVDEHRYQLQRHARKLKARVFAPRYRLAPQDPFPCGLQDCLAAYLHLLTLQDPSTIIMAGDSAGGGMIVSIMVILRDQGLPLPAGAVLISPWVDLTHSFPSVAGDSMFDYIPGGGFHHKPSVAWPPPSQKELDEMKQIALQQRKQATNNGKSAKDRTAGDAMEPSIGDITSTTTKLKLVVDDEPIEVDEQIQMYTTNELLSHPLVSPVMQPTLGGLPPLLIMVGGGELLRDEQIYLAHKCANPKAYLPAESLLTEKDIARIQQYKPTDVQLQVWDDLCHVAPTMSFTRPAKYMYRSVAQFSAWALARAQNTEIEIMDDDQVSIISTDSSNDESESTTKTKPSKVSELKDANDKRIGIAGDALPPFSSHMIRQRVTRHGDIFPLAPASELPGCSMAAELVGVVKQGPVKKWMAQKQHWDTRFASTKKKVQKALIKDLNTGFDGFAEGEFPPPSAVASRRRGARKAAQRKTKSMGLAMWSGWGSKHDEMTVKREQELDREPETTAATKHEGGNARPFIDIQQQDPVAPPVAAKDAGRSRSRRKSVRDERQTEIAGESIDENTPVSRILALRKEAANGSSKSALPTMSTRPSYLSPDYEPAQADTGVTGKRAYVDGIAVPFALGKDAETASMMTLTSAIDQVTPMAQDRGEFFAGPRRSSTNPAAESTKDASQHGRVTPATEHTIEVKSAGPAADPAPSGEQKTTTSAPTVTEHASDKMLGAKAAALTQASSQDNDHGIKDGDDNDVTPKADQYQEEAFFTPAVERPGLDTFVTAVEDLPKVSTALKA